MKTIHKLTFIQKILLSIIPILSTLFFIDTFVLYSIPYEFYSNIWLILFILIIIQNIILIVRVTKIDTDRSTKVLYIILFISVLIFHLFYVWVLDEKILGDK